MAGINHAGSAVMEFTGEDEREILEKILEWLREEIGTENICPTIFSISFSGDEGDEDETQIRAYVAYE